MTNLEKFYQTLMQDVKSLQLAHEDGDSQEQIFTRTVLDILSEEGETENAVVAYDERNLGTRNQIKINGYAISDNYETIDLFISIFYNSDTIKYVTKSEIDLATKRISNFFQKTISTNYVDDIAESSTIFEFAHTLASCSELRQNLIRINAIILTNGESKSTPQLKTEFLGYSVFYRIIDISYLYKISEHSRIPIELDFTNFDGENFQLPCLTGTENNPNYKTYIAIIPGPCLVKMYEQYGARLLEQNVRAFLQFTGKINKGIRDTIRNEPHMFLAFNNGIAATADDIELDETCHYIRKVKNLQIVNGGQTTASIYNVARKDKADISKIFVQIKFTVIAQQDQYSEIVSRISKCANTQNKVNDADFSANNPALIKLEKLSRYILAPITSQNATQTCWFFERARGQYKTLRSREGKTPAQQKAFDIKYPKEQMFTKVELAKFINSYKELTDDKKTIIGPHIVVRGNEKNYAQFIAYNLPQNINSLDAVYFEDLISKCILFKTADKRYGKKPNSIGELKQVVVPYTLSLITKITQNKLNLYKIWLNQQVSPELSDFLYTVMRSINQFIINEAKIRNLTHYIEWAKKEDCWNLVKNHNWEFDLTQIVGDLIDEKNPPKRNTKINISEEEHQKNKAFVESIPYALWYKLYEWGKDSKFFDITKQNIASNIAYKLRQNKKLTEDEYKKGVDLIDIVNAQNPELLKNPEDYKDKAPQLNKIKLSDGEINTLLLALIQKMINFNRMHDILTIEDSDLLADILNEKEALNDDNKEQIYSICKLLRTKGFNPAD